MRAALWIVILLALGVAIVLLAGMDQGYVIVVFPPWRMELSILLTVALLVGGFFLASFLLHLARTALRLPRDLRAWRQRRAQTAADAALTEALRAHFLGDKTRLRKALKKAKDCTTPDLLPYLQATLAETAPPPGELPPAPRQITTAHGAG